VVVNTEMGKDIEAVVD